MSNTYCPLPWVHLATHPMGHVTLCCESDMTNNASTARDIIETIDGKHINGDIKYLAKDTLIGITNSDYFNNVRKQMIAGEEPVACTRCFDRERKGLDSKRLLEQREYPHYTFNTAIKNTCPSTGELIKMDYRFVELRLGNICNVKCRTCNPASSNRIKTDYNKLQNSKWDGVDQIPHYNGLEEFDFNWCESEAFYDDLISSSVNLESMYINGGEPTLIKQHWRFLEKLVESGLSKQIKVWYSLNMTNIPDFAFDIWRAFKHVEIRASIDDIHERNTYIRYPTKWSDVLTSVDKCLINNDVVDFKILQTISAYNFMYINEFHKYWQTMTDVPISIAHNFVMYPDFMSPHALPNGVRNEIINMLVDGDSIPWHQKQEIASMFSDDNPDSDRLYNVFTNYTAELDKIRKQSFAETFPELAKALY